MPTKQVWRASGGVWRRRGGLVFIPPLLTGARIAAVRSQSVRAAPTYRRPVGAGYTTYESISSGVTVQQTFNAVPVGQQLTLPAGSFTFYDFANGAGNYGVLAGENCYGWAGSGVDVTVFSMVAGSSTKAGSVPVQSTGGTNQLTLMRTGTTTSGHVLSPTVQGCTLLGTDQPVDPNTGKPHTYNGLQLYQATAPQVSDVKIKGIPGNNAANPGETFSINVYRSDDSVITRYEGDGANPAGVKVAATLLGYNYVHNLTVSDSLLHDTGSGWALASFQGTGTFNITNVVASGCTGPFNFEQNVATINLRGCTASGNRAMTTSGAIQPIFAVVDGNLGSSVVNIYDPTLDTGAPTPGNPCIVVRHAGYGGVASTQLVSDIHLFMGGVERPDCLRIATNETLPSA